MRQKIRNCLLCFLSFFKHMNISFNMGFHKNYSCSSLEVVSVTVNWSVSNLGRSPFFLLLILWIHFGSSLSSPFSLLWSIKVLQCLTPVCGREVGEWRRKSTSSMECLGIWCGMEIWCGYFCEYFIGLPTFLSLTCCCTININIFYNALFPQTFSILAL